MVNSTSGSKRRKKEIKTGRGGLAMGYEVMEIRDDADEGQLRLCSVAGQVKGEEGN